LKEQLRNLFPCKPTDAEAFKTYIELLREHYSFTRVPKAFFVEKQRLPFNPKELNLKGKYTFPITETGKISVFFKEIRGDYRIPIPLPKQYSDLNFMNKPDLPDTPEQITDIHFQTNSKGLDQNS
ncbi:12304_t:CDS:2, partial [Gigaspora rosea]